MTAFDDALSSHITTLRLRNLRPGTIVQRRYAMRRLQLRLDGLDPLEATPEDIERWAVLIEPLSPYTRSCEIAHVAQFYRWAVTKRIIERDPTLELPRPKKPKGLPRPIGEKDLLVAIAGAPAEERLWFLIAAWAGLRAGEIAHLKREEILDTAPTPAMRVTGKGDKTRIVPIGERLILEMHAFGLPSRGYVFGRKDGKAGCNSPARVSQRANRVLHGLGIGATLHQLRHRYGTQLYEVSKDQRMVQEVLGHNDQDTTSGYVAYSPSAAAAAAIVLDQTLGQVLIDSAQQMLL